MMPITMEGMYENGRVELAGKPGGVKRAKVIVTFFPEVEAGEEQEGQQAPAPIAADETAPVVPATEPLYPPALREEYKSLIRKKLHRTLTVLEAARLDTIRQEMNQRDRQAVAWAAWESRHKEVEETLVSLRQELEALPNA